MITGKLVYEDLTIEWNRLEKNTIRFTDEEGHEEVLVLSDLELGNIINCLIAGIDEGPGWEAAEKIVGHFPLNLRPIP